MKHDQNAHIAYEKLAEALNNYIKISTKDATSRASDWLLISAIENDMPMQVGYLMPVSYSPPHTLIGLLDEASSILASDQYDRRAHENGECTCYESD